MNFMHFRTSSVCNRLLTFQVSSGSHLEVMIFSGSSCNRVKSKVDLYPQLAPKRCI